MQAVTDQILEVLRSAGYRPGDLRPEREAPFDLDEASGVRLGLLFLAVKPLRRLDRIEAVADSVRSMAPEEMYYWFAKCSRAGKARRAQKALRTLLTEAR